MIPNLKTLLIYIVITFAGSGGVLVYNLVEKGASPSLALSCLFDDAPGYCLGNYIQFGPDRFRQDRAGFSPHNSRLVSVSVMVQFLLGLAFLVLGARQSAGGRRIYFGAKGVFSGLLFSIPFHFLYISYSTAPLFLPDLNGLVLFFIPALLVIIAGVMALALTLIRRLNE